MYSAWQYFSFRFNAKNSAASFQPASNSDLQSSCWDGNGFFEDSMGTPASHQRLTTSSSIGRLINITGKAEYPLIGLIYAVSIYNTWDNGSPSTRSAFVDLHKNSYPLHFKLDDMAQNTHVDGLITK